MVAVLSGFLRYTRSAGFPAGAGATLPQQAPGEKQTPAQQKWKRGQVLIYHFPVTRLMRRKEDKETSKEKSGFKTCSLFDPRADGEYLKSALYGLAGGGLS